MTAMTFAHGLADGLFGLFWLVAVLAFTRWDAERIRARRVRRQFAGNRRPRRSA